MKVLEIKKTIGQKMMGGSLPDIDTDFEANKRGDVKEYIETRFGKNQVVSVGTFTTLKLKGALKDLDRQFDNDVYTANVVTSIIDEKDSTMLDLFKRSTQEPKLKEYIKRNSDIFYLMPSILNQPKAKSIHPCAMVIFPNVMEAQEWIPVRKQNGLIVAEFGGGEMELAGFLKLDVLGIKQLDKFSHILKLIGENGKTAPDIYDLPHDVEVYRYFSNGWNGDVFQMGTDPLSAYTKYLKPDNIEDLIATVSLYRPGPMENNYHNIYVKAKNEGIEHKPLWGTEEITKDTYNLIVYQEQIMAICQQLGSLNMQEADDVRRAMGKKDLKYLSIWKDRLEIGFLENGATKEQFEETWNMMVEFAKYSFNRSHAAAYAKTGYICQYLKVHFPLEYWTTSLTEASEENGLKYLSEIFDSKGIDVNPPNINGSGIKMTSNNDSNTIYWGIGSIKGIGEATAEQIINVRNEYGDYKSFADFYDRHNFKGSKVKKQTFEALISSGAFDALYGFKKDVNKRVSLITRFRKFKKVKVSNKKTDIYTIGTLEHSWWWSLQQKKLTGLAFLDYKNLAKENGLTTGFANSSELLQPNYGGLFRSFGGYVVEMKTRSSVKGTFAFLTIESNYKIYKLILWSNEYQMYKDVLKKCEKNFVLFDGLIKYDAKYEKKNTFILQENSKVVVLS